MKLIAGGENSARQPDRDKQKRHLYSQIRSATQRPPEKYSEDRVFTDVPELADKKMDLRQRTGRNVRFQPAQKRNKKARSLLR